MLQRIWRGLVLAAAGAMVGMMTAAACAQTVYLPVQYQYGRQGEIFYGGTNPYFLSNPHIFMPEVPRNAAAVAMVNGAGQGRAVAQPGWYTPALAPLAAKFGFSSVAHRPLRFDVPVALRRPYIFSDLQPFEEVGQYGFTANDARNEAYLNVPVYQAGAAVGAAEAPAPAPAAPPAPTVEDKNPAKAVPLLEWARREMVKGTNPPLVEALLYEAAKYDPAATAALRAQGK